MCASDFGATREVRTTPQEPAYLEASHRGLVDRAQAVLYSIHDVAATTCHAGRRRMRSVWAEETDMKRQRAACQGCGEMWRWPSARRSMMHLCTVYLAGCCDAAVIRTRRTSCEDAVT